MDSHDSSESAQAASIIREFITKEFLYGRSDVRLTSDFRLIDQGIIDSMGIFRLITFLETTFGKKLELAEIEYENFQTISDIAALVTRSEQS